MTELGTHVKDKINGFSGTAAGRMVWLSGHSQIAIKSRELDDKGNPRDLHWVDESLVEVLEG